MFKSKKIPLLILGVTSMILSRTTFAFFNDPEGPNLLVVFVLASVLYGISLVPHLIDSSTGISRKKLALMIVIQVFAAYGIYNLL